MTRPRSILPAVVAALVLPGAALGQGFGSAPEETLLRLARDPAVQRELGLSAEAARGVLAATDSIDGPWWRSRELPAAERREGLATLTGRLRTGLRGVLDDAQTRRLDQLELRGMGMAVLGRDEVADAIGLEDSQRQSVMRVVAATSRGAEELRTRLADATGPQRDALARQLADAERDGVTRVFAELTAEQQTRLRDLLGAPFDFSTLTRVYPRAPEIDPAGGQWLQGGPLRLADLRGKVVALHFYAFQCINCIHNLPHYSAWAKEFENEDFVVVGVQTPELSLERDPDAVAAAIRRDGITYPVLLDSKYATWRAWGNNVWPAVYLIDRDGYVRSWWTGEMNWGGVEGEKILRARIRRLLEEQADPVAAAGAVAAADGKTAREKS